MHLARGVFVTRVINGCLIGLTDFIFFLEQKNGRYIQSPLLLPQVVLQK